MLPRIRNCQPDLLIMGQDVDGALARSPRLPSSSNRSRRRATSPRYASTTSRTATRRPRSARGDFAAALQRYLPHLAAMEMLLEEGDPTIPASGGARDVPSTGGVQSGRACDRVAARRPRTVSSLMKRYRTSCPTTSSAAGTSGGPDSIWGSSCSRVMTRPCVPRAPITSSRHPA